MDGEYETLSNPQFRSQHSISAAKHYKAWRRLEMLEYSGWKNRLETDHLTDMCSWKILQGVDCWLRLRIIGRYCEENEVPFAF
jgi:hypothetical protein